MLSSDTSRSYSRQARSLIAICGLHPTIESGRAPYRRPSDSSVGDRFLRNLAGIFPPRTRVNCIPANLLGGLPVHVLREQRTQGDKHELGSRIRQLEANLRND